MLVKCIKTYETALYGMVVATEGKTYQTTPCYGSNRFAIIGEFGRLYSFDNFGSSERISLTDHHFVKISDDGADPIRLESIERMTSFDWNELSTHELLSIADSFRNKGEHKKFSDKFKGRRA